MEYVVEFISFIIQVFLWYVFFSVVFNLLQRWVNRDTPSVEERQAMIKRVASLIHDVKPETHGDMIYWFDAETDQFLGQGRNEEEIKQHLLERFKGHVFVVDNERALAGPKLEEVPLHKLKLINDGTAIN